MLHQDKGLPTVRGYSIALDDGERSVALFGLSFDVDALSSFCGRFKKSRNVTVNVTVFKFYFVYEYCEYFDVNRKKGKEEVDSLRATACVRFLREHISRLYIIN